MMSRNLVTNLSVADKGKHFSHIVHKFPCPANFDDRSVSGDLELCAGDRRYLVHSAVILPLSPFLRQITEHFLDKQAAVKVVLDQIYSGALK